MRPERVRWWRRVALTTVLVGLGGTAFGGEASFQGLGDLPGGEIYSRADGVSADGTTVIGVSRGPDPGIPFKTSEEAFRWTAGEGMVGLGDLDPTFVRSRALGVSADGSVIVGRGSLGADGSVPAPFRWTAATGMVRLVEPSGAPSEITVFAVSGDGSTVVGQNSPIAGGTVAARWTETEGVLLLGSLPNSLGFPDAFASGVSADGSVVAGQSFGAFVQPIRWTPGSGLIGLGDVPGGIQYALGWGVSADGTTIVGGARTTFGGPGTNDEAFLWTEVTGFVPLDPRRGQDFSSFAYAASADGSVVVGTSDNGAWIWDGRHGMRLILDILTDDFGLDLTGWRLDWATGVSADGQTVVGAGRNPNGHQEAWIAHLPQQAANPVPAADDWGFAVSILVLLTAGSCVLVRRRVTSASLDA